MDRFPTIQILARAPLADCLAVWQGLGYNRRAVSLHRLAQTVAGQFGGILPGDIETLMTLPGIGPYTAKAVCAFAFNKPSVLIETNIRSVFIHHFFADRTNVPDDELLPFIEAALDRKNPRRWYSALMDYGSHLKKMTANPSRKSAHYTKQKPFKGSDRQIRGQIIRLFLAAPKQMLRALLSETGATEKRLNGILKSLEMDGFIVKKGRAYFLIGK